MNLFRNACFSTTFCASSSLPLLDFFLQKIRKKKHFGEFGFFERWSTEQTNTHRSTKWEENYSKQNWFCPNQGNRDKRNGQNGMCLCVCVGQKRLQIFYARRTFACHTQNSAQNYGLVRATCAYIDRITLRKHQKVVVHTHTHDARTILFTIKFSMKRKSSQKSMNIHYTLCFVWCVLCVCVLNAFHYLLTWTTMTAAITLLASIIHLLLRYTRMLFAVIVVILQRSTTHHITSNTSST